jgi:hypothetical protein
MVLMKKSNFQQTMEKLSKEKEGAIQKLIEKPFEELREIARDYWRRYKDAEESGFDEPAKVNSFKYQIIKEAIEIKQGNEETAWDYLT